MPHRRPPHLSADHYTGAARIFLTMCTFRRRPHFDAPLTVERVCEQLLQTATRLAVEVIAYCFMKDHLHLLVSGTAEDADAMKFCATFRQVSAYHYRCVHRQRLWQDGFYDRVLRDSDSTFDVVCYIVANPIRAGLVDTVTEYPHVGSSRFSLEEIVTSVQWRPDALG
jgi:putative transposase